MRTLYLSLILCCLGVHSSSALEELIEKKGGNWVMVVLADEFTKEKSAMIMEGRKDTFVQIFASQRLLEDDGKAVPARLIQLWTKERLFTSDPNQKIVGIFVDGVSMAIKGKTWKKDLIAAMLKGKKFVMRVEDYGPVDKFHPNGSKRKRTLTTVASLEGFAECWAAIPKDLIDLEEASGINGTKKPPTVPTPQRDKPTHIIVKIRLWTPTIEGVSPFEGTLASYDSDSGKVAIKRKSNGRTLILDKDELSKSDQGYLGIVALAQKQGIPLNKPSLGPTPTPNNTTHFTTKNIRWVYADSDGEYEEGVLLAYDAKSEVGFVRLSGEVGSLGFPPLHSPSGCITRIEKDSLIAGAQKYLNLVAQQQEKGMSLKVAEDQRTHFFVAPRKWTGSNGKTLKGVLLSYDSDSGEALVKGESEGTRLTIKKRNLSRLDQIYLEVIATYHKKGMPLKFRGYPSTEVKILQKRSALGLKEDEVVKRTVWDSDRYIAVLNRTWASGDGSKQFDGVLLSFGRGSQQAEIKRKADGRTFKIDKDKLSRTDQLYLSFVSFNQVKGFRLKVVEE